MNALVCLFSYLRVCVCVCVCVVCVSVYVWCVVCVSVWCVCVCVCVCLALVSSGSNLRIHFILLKCALVPYYNNIHKLLIKMHGINIKISRVQIWNCYQNKFWICGIVFKYEHPSPKLRHMLDKELYIFRLKTSIQTQYTPDSRGARVVTAILSVLHPLY